MTLKTAKITVALVRSFSVGFSIHSPKWNGLSFEVNVGCFALRFWSRGVCLFAAKNYWNG